MTGLALLLGVVALLLGIAAFVLALIGRLEQVRLVKQIDRLRQMVFRLQAQPPAQPASLPKQDRQTTAPPEAGVGIQPAPSAPIKPTPPSDLSDKNQTLQRITSAPHTDPKRSPHAPPARPVSKPKAKPKSVSLEERLGAGLYVWVGGIALMLAGAFLVKYSFDNNLLSIPARLAIAGVFGAALVLASLWLRSRADKVAAAVCGAGVADLFATVLAASAFYEVIGPWWGFALMALVTAMAVGMSLIHGRFVALLGLVGGFATPTLISGTESAWGLTFTYLLLLEIGLAVVTRKKQWFGLSALTLVASVLSALVYTLFAWNPDSRYWLILFVLGSAIVFVVNAARSTEQEEGKPSVLRRIWLGLGAVGTSALLMTLLVGYSHFSIMELSAMGLLAAGSLVLARLDRRYITLAYLSAGLCGMMLLAWPAAHRIGSVELNTIHYYLLAIGYGLTFFIGGLMCLWRSARPGLFAWLSAGSALAFVILPHIGRSQQLPDPLRWWMVYAAMAAIVVVCTALVWRTRLRYGTLIIDAYALMAAALATFAVWFALVPPWVAPAWCGLAVVVAAIGMKLNLRWLVIPTGWLTAGCVCLLIVPGPRGYDMPMGLIFNTMLAHYGLPALGFAAIAWVYHRDPWTWLREVFQAIGLVVATATISLQIRLGFHPEALWNNPADLIEWSTHAGLWLAFGIGVLWWFKQASLSGLRGAAVGIGVVGLITAVLYPLLIANPLLAEAEVGDTLVLNWLLYIYGLPCLLAAVLACTCRTKKLPMKPIAAAVSLLLLFVFVSMQVRQGFVGGDLLLDTHPITSAENYSYSLAWVLLALSLLAGGLVSGSAALRYGSLAVMLVAVGKVAVDTAQLRDLWRVLSLLGLGLSLIVLGYVYQRYVFRRPKQPDIGQDEPAMLQDSE